MNAFLKKSNVGVGVILLITLVVYIPAMQGGFIWDDDSYVTDNPNLSSLEGLKRTWFEPRSSPQYYPMVFTTFWLEHALWGLHPLGYHVVNVLLHATNAVLLLIILKRLNVSACLFAGVLFALHPVHVESVAWITERKNVLSTLFYLSAALSLLGFLNLDNQQRSRRTIWIVYTLGLFLFLCALFSKTVTASLPAAMLLAVWWKRGRIRRQEVLLLMPFFALSLGSGLATVWIENVHVGARGEEWDLSAIERCLVAGRAVWFYAGKLFFPKELIFNYPRWNIEQAVWWQYLYPVSLLALICALFSFRDRIGRGPLTGVLFFCGTLVPALGFFNVYPFRYSYVADHFQYLASIGLLGLASATLSQAFVRVRRRLPGIGFLVSLCILGLLGIQTWSQSHMYRNLEELWNWTLERNPKSWLAHNNLGIVLDERERLEEAIVHFSEAIRIKPDYADAHINMGLSFVEQGKLREAMHSYSEALRIKPDHPIALNSTGAAMAKQGKLKEAISHYSKALSIKPDYAEAHYNMGIALDKLGRLEEAVDYYSEALRITPNNAFIHNNLGATLSDLGRLEEAISHFSAALRIKPDYTEAQYNLRICLRRAHNSSTDRISR